MALEIQHEFDRRDKVGSCIDTMKRLEHHMENVIRQQFGVSVTITMRGGSGEVNRSIGGVKSVIHPPKPTVALPRGSFATLKLAFL
jgi:hypothetical protein